MKSLNTFIDEESSKKCPDGQYYCFTDKKCKKIPRGYFVGRRGYLEQEKDSEESKKNGKNGNGNGNGNGGSTNGNGGSNGGSNGGGNGGGGMSEELNKDDKPFVKKLVGKLRKGSKTHAKQADDLEKAMNEESNPRIPRKKGQPANSKKHSDLYTDENPKGTIHGLGFKDVATAKASVSKIRGSSRSHAHKIQAAVAMEQRAREMGKTSEAAVYRKYINSMKKKTKKMNEEKHGDHEPEMIRSQLKTAGRASKRIEKHSRKKDNFKAWVQSKITKASDYLDTAADYLDSKDMKKEAANPAQQAAIAINMKKKGKKPKDMSEGSLRQWFKGSKSKDGKGGWVNVVTGGTCASDEPGEGTPKCVSSSKRASMTKAERLSAARRKKKADPGQQQKTGAAKPTYVSTDKPKKKMKEEIELTEVKDKKGKGSGTKDACYHKVKSRYSVWPSAYASGALVKCRKVGAANWGNKSEEVEMSVDEAMSSYDRNRKAAAKRAAQRNAERRAGTRGGRMERETYRSESGVQMHHKGYRANANEEVIPEAKVDKGRSDYGKASIRNYRRMGPGHGDPGMFDPEGKRGKTIEKRREEHKARRGVKGAKVPAYKVDEGSSYGLYRGSGKPSGAMKKYLDNAKKMQDADKKKKKTGNPAFDDPSHHSNAKNRTEQVTFQQFQEKCWPGYEKKGMKTMFGKRYPNCVKKKK